MSNVKTFYETWTREMEDGCLSKGFKEVVAEWYCFHSRFMGFPPCEPDDRHGGGDCHWAVKP